MSIDPTFGEETEFEAREEVIEVVETLSLTELDMTFEELEKWMVEKTIQHGAYHEFKLDSYHYDDAYFELLGTRFETDEEAVARKKRSEAAKRAAATRAAKAAEKDAAQREKDIELIAQLKTKYPEEFR